MSINIDITKNISHDTTDRVNLGISLLSQQIWCWGKDILRDEGNWLIDEGFNVINAPEDFKNARNIYWLDLPGGKRIILRGFGIVYSDSRYGSIFVHRFKLLPKYSVSPELDILPWNTSCLEGFDQPVGIEKQFCSIMLTDLIDWIIGYEQKLTAKLGIDYRKSTIKQWDNGKRCIIDAEDIVLEWKKLRIKIQLILEQNI